MKDLKLFVTLWPSFDHFKDFSQDGRLTGIRLNSAMISGPNLDKELKIAQNSNSKVPFYLDLKGRQLRLTEVEFDKPKKEIVLTLNHPISVKTPFPLLLKAGEDFALVGEIRDSGRKLVIIPDKKGPNYTINIGESIHILEPDLKVLGPTFLPQEIEKIEKAKSFGFKKFFLSYVQTQRDVDEFRSLVGRDSEIYLKIEDKKGLRYLETEFKKEEGIKLCAAMGDLYVEVDRPHHILEAVRTIIKHDPEAMAGSRMMLTIVRSPVPDAADFMQLAWLYDQGFKTMMLCDEICLKRTWLDPAVSALNSFKDSYALDERMGRKAVARETADRLGWFKKIFGDN